MHSCGAWSRAHRCRGGAASRLGMASTIERFEVFVGIQRRRRRAVEQKLTVLATASLRERSEAGPRGDSLSENTGVVVRDPQRDAAKCVGSPL